MRLRDPEQVVLDVARRIAELRRRRGWTQEALAGEAGVSEKYVQRVESGHSNLTLRTVTTFALALRVDVAELFFVSSLPPQPPGRPRARVRPG